MTRHLVETQDGQRGVVDDERMIWRPILPSWFCPVCPAGASVTARDDRLLEEKVEEHELVVHGIGPLPAFTFETNRVAFLAEAELIEAIRALGLVTS